MNLTQIIKRPIVTEKSHDEMQHRSRYTFEVAREANKDQIKAAVEKYLGVKVVKVNTMISAGEMRRTGRRRLPSPITPTKKAIVEIAKDQKLNILNQNN